MVNQVSKLAMPVDRSQIDLANGVADAIATISGTVGVASVGGARHQDAHEFRADRRSTEAQRGHPTLRICGGSGGEGLPRTLVLFVHGIAVADPVLHFERLRVGIP